MDKINRIKSEHPGEWIGMKDKKVVVTSNTHRELYKTLKDKGIHGVHVFYSPTQKEKKYGFLLHCDKSKWK